MDLIKYRETPTTQYKEQLSTIKVDLLSYPSVEELKSYIPEFCLATWEDAPGTYTDEERENAIINLFGGKLLPTAFETIRLTFRVSGLDLIDVTHLIRHRTLSFSAQCTADRDMRHDDCMVKGSILNHSVFFDRYADLVDMAKELYSDMVDSKEVSILDARTILPRSLSSFYYVSGNIKDILQFIKTRVDEQIQPQSDNVIAMRMYQEMCKVYPFLKGTIKIGGVDKWYCDTMNSGHASNIYPPKPINRVYCQDNNIDYTHTHFIYDKPREEFHGSEYYLNIKEEVIKDTQ